MSVKEPQFCAPWAANQTEILVMTLVAVGVVAGVNAGLELLLKELAAFQKPHTMSELETSIATLVFSAQYVNTGILVLIYTMKPDGIESFLFQWLVRFQREVLDQQIFSGTFADTNFQWYSVVGNKIFMQCVTQSIMPNVTMLTKWPVEVAKQNLLKNHQLTQKKLNKLYEGSEYPLSKRYANMLNIMFVIMTYAGAIPMLYMFGIIYFFTAYWGDKVAILRGCKRPAQYDEKLAMAATTRMSFAMAVHLMFSVWFLGYPDADNINNSAFLGTWGVRFFVPFLQQMFLTGASEQMLYARVSKTPSFFMFAYMLLWAAFELIMRTVGPTLLHAIQQRLGVAEEEFKEGNPSFFEALENQEISGLDTYNIKKNPRYRDAFSSEIVEVDDDDDDDGDDDDDFGADDDED